MTLTYWTYTLCSGVINSGSIYINININIISIIVTNEKKYLNDRNITPYMRQTDREGVVSFFSRSHLITQYKQQQYLVSCFSQKFRLFIINDQVSKRERERVAFFNGNQLKTRKKRFSVEFIIIMNSKRSSSSSSYLLLCHHMVPLLPLCLVVSVFACVCVCDNHNDWTDRLTILKHAQQQQQKKFPKNKYAYEFCMHTSCVCV